MILNIRAPHFTADIEINKEKICSKAPANARVFRGKSEDHIKQVCNTNRWKVMEK